MAWKTKSKTNDTWIILIGLFKLVKVASLVIVGIGAIKLLHRDVATSVTHWVEALRLDPDNQYIHRGLSRVFRITPKQLRELSAGTFIYAGLYLTEGIGLLMRKHWAEYFTTISTMLFIPIEVYEMFRRFTWMKVGLIAVNVAIVWYLIARIRSRR